MHAAGKAPVFGLKIGRPRLVKYFSLTEAIWRHLQSACWWSVPPGYWGNQGLAARHHRFLKQAFPAAEIRVPQRAIEETIWLGSVG